MVRGAGCPQTGKLFASVTAALIVVLICICIAPAPVYGGQEDTGSPDIYAVAEGVIAWEKAQAGAEGGLLDGSFTEYAGSSAGDWFPFGFGRLGVPDNYAAYLSSLTGNVEERYDKDGTLSANKATEWHRISLAMLAAGGDPTRAGKTKGNADINLIADGVYNRGRVAPLDAQGLNGLVWGLIALDSFRYDVPDDAYCSRRDLISDILSEQLPDGGFSLEGDAGSADITAMVVTALAPYYNSEEKFMVETPSAGDRDDTSAEKNRDVLVRDAVDSALKWLSENQLDDGDFSAWGDPNSESASQIIVALCSVGIDPASDKRFVKKGNSAVDGLLKYRMKDGSFSHTFGDALSAPSASMASEQALYALTALLRFKNDRRALFDFRPETPAAVRDSINAVDEAIAALPDAVGPSDAEKVSTLFAKYRQIPAEERSYVRGYRRLADAMNALGIPNDSEPLSEYMELNDGGDGAVTDVMTGADLKPEIERMAEAAAATDSEIEDINSGVMGGLYPFDRISRGDKDELEGYIARIELLEEKDRERVSGYKELLAAEKRLTDQTAVLTVAVSVCAAVAVLFILLLMRKRRKGKHGG
jgi:hypothetical protein